MGGGGVNDHGIRGSDQGDGFNGRSVRQAEESDIRIIQRILPGGRILAELFRQGNQGKILPAGETFADPEAGGSGTAINKNFVIGSGILSDWEILTSTCM